MAAAQTVMNFDSVPPGELPTGWLSGVTGDGRPKWAVVRDDSAPRAKSSKCVTLSAFVHTPTHGPGGQ